MRLQRGTTTKTGQKQADSNDDRSREYPVAFALIDAFVQKAAQTTKFDAALEKLLCATPRNRDEAIQHLHDLADVRRRLEPLLKEARQLGSWLGVSPSYISSEGKHAKINSLIVEGATFKEAETIVKQLRSEYGRGRRATKKHLAVQALDFYITNPKMSWTHVTRKLCNCGARTHGPMCHERLRQALNDLRQFMKTSCIPIPRRYPQ